MWAAACVQLATWRLFHRAYPTVSKCAGSSASFHHPRRPIKVCHSRLSGRQRITHADRPCCTGSAAWLPACSAWVSTSHVGCLSYDGVHCCKALAFDSFGLRLGHADAEEVGPASAATDTEETLPSPVRVVCDTLYGWYYPADGQLSRDGHDGVRPAWYNTLLCPPKNRVCTSSDIKVINLLRGLCPWCTR